MYLSYKMSNVRLVQALHLCTVCNIVHHWQDMATAEQLNQVINQALLQLKLEEELLHSAVPSYTLISGTLTCTLTSSIG